MTIQRAIYPETAGEQRRAVGRSGHEPQNERRVDQTPHAEEPKPTTLIGSHNIDRADFELREIYLLPPPESQNYGPA